MLREARGGLKATVGNRVKPDYHFIRIVFFVCSFLFLSARFRCFPSRLCSKACQYILDIVGLSHAEVCRTYLNLFNSHCYSFMKTNLIMIKAYHLRFCWQQLFGLLRNITSSLKSIRPNKTEIKIIAEKNV